MQKQTESISTSNTDKFRNMARMSGNINMTQIMHNRIYPNINITQTLPKETLDLLNITTQLPVTTTIDDTPELKTNLWRRSNNNLL